jgi:hypothetical protein
VVVAEEDTIEELEAALADLELARLYLLQPEILILLQLAVVELLAHLRQMEEQVIILFLAQLHRLAADTELVILQRQIQPAMEVLAVAAIT